MILSDVDISCIPSCCLIEESDIDKLSTNEVNSNSELIIDVELLDKLSKIDQNSNNDIIIDEELLG